ncbi:MAG: hypothetical protein H6737_16580 [Alphaproteobacteria bacterium]|nr:hypothetical protein [Alphaproteobacteria bacterium]
MQVEAAALFLRPDDERCAVQPDVDGAAIGVQDDLGVRVSDQRRHGERRVLRRAVLNCASSTQSPDELRRLP